MKLSKTLSNFAQKYGLEVSRFPVKFRNVTTGYTFEFSYPNDTDNYGNRLIVATAKKERDDNYWVIHVSAWQGRQSYYPTTIRGVELPKPDNRWDLHSVGCNYFRENVVFTPKEK
jgi:hypothetical protein